MTIIIQIQNDVVDVLALWVDGKTERLQKCLLQLYRDVEVPEFDAIGHLLAHIESNSLVSGYVFPCKRWFRNNRNPDLLKPITYTEFNTDFQNLCKKLLGRPGPFGLHCARKTAYLFAKWYGADLNESMQAARHAAVENAQRYYQDAGAVFDMIRRTIPYNMLAI